MVTQTFGDMLYYPEKDSLKEFPSPESLKNKIIISTKPPKEYLKSKNSKENNPQKEKDTSDEETWGKEVEVQKSEPESDDKVQFLLYECIFSCFSEKFELLMFIIMKFQQSLAE